MHACRRILSPSHMHICRAPLRLPLSLRDGADNTRTWHAPGNEEGSPSTILIGNSYVVEVTTSPPPEKFFRVILKSKSEKDIVNVSYR